MIDGLVILLMGLGVVFVFLVILMGFIKLLSLRKARPLIHACMAGVPAFRPKVTGPGKRVDLGAKVDDGTDEGAHLAAAVAVALVLSARRPPRPSLVAEGPSNWRSAGRADQMKVLGSRR